MTINKCVKCFAQNIILIVLLCATFRQYELSEEGKVWQDATVSSEVAGRTSSQDIPGSEASEDGHPGG